MPGPLIIWQWDGDALVPLPRFRKQCDAELVVGELYRMEAQEERSRNSHRHYFATLAEIWQNLPESANLEPWAQTTETMRKHALIRCGYVDTQTFVCGSQAEAKRMATVMRGRPRDEYEIVMAKGACVYSYVAKSQSMKAMGKRDFQASKDAVLTFCEGLIGAQVTGFSA